MGWYQVIKTINGRKYLYLQMTYREGKKIRTKNKYLGPLSGRGFGLYAGAAKLPTATTSRTATPSGGLRIARIKRIDDLSKPKQKQYMRESIRKRKADWVRTDRAHLKSNLTREEWKTFLELERHARVRRREAREQKKANAPKKKSWWQW